MIEHTVFYKSMQIQHERTSRKGLKFKAGKGAEKKKTEGIKMSVKDFFSFEADAQKNDYTLIQTKDNKDRDITLKIINKGLTSNWKDIKYKVEFYYENKKENELNFNKAKDLYDFLEVNNIKI